MGGFFEVTMNPKRNVTALDTVKYGGVMMLANLGGTIAALIALMAARVHRMDLRFEGRE